MSELRCKPGDLCVVVPSDNPTCSNLLAPLFGVFTTVTTLCAQTEGYSTRSWHTKDPLWLPASVGMFEVHAIPDTNLKPIRGATPSKETGTWSPKKQTLLTR